MHGPDDIAGGTDAAWPPADVRRVPVLNAHVNDVTMDDLVHRFRSGLLLTLHPDMLVKLQKDRAFYDAFREFDVVTCDSQILFWALKLMGTPVTERLSGSDYFPRFYLAHRDDPGVRIFILGGAPGVAATAADRINAKVGRDIVVGTAAPPKGFDADPRATADLLDQINSSEATVLAVCLGGGPQEKFIVRHRAALPRVRLFLPLGGTVDYEAGTVRRPPAWVTNAGLEWFARVLQNPRTRARRYFVEQPPVLWLLLKQRLGRYRDPFA